MAISMALGNAYVWLRGFQSEQWFVAYSFIAGVCSIVSLALIVLADRVDTLIIKEARQDFKKAKSAAKASSSKSIFSKVAYGIVALAVIVDRKLSTPAMIEAAKLIEQKRIEDAALAKQERGLKRKERSQRLKAFGRVATATGILSATLALVVKPDAPIPDCQPVLKPSVTRADLIDPRNIKPPMPHVLLVPCYSRA